MAGQRAHAILSFKGYLISCFYHVICGNDSVRPATEGHPPAAGKGGDNARVDWGSNPQPSTRVNEQYVEQ
nr:MAG TPA: hypothetical protein [Caudoviricetes sp.]